MSRLETLKNELPPPSERALGKVVASMSSEVQRFIANAPFVIVSSSNSDGDCDASPEGGKPSFIKVLDARTLVIPDICGNRLFQGFSNFQPNPKVGLLFMIPGVDRTVRVNGRVHELGREGVEGHGVGVEIHNPDSNSNLIQGLQVHVDEAYTHCPRALRFSKLWDTDVIVQNREHHGLQT